MKNLDKFKIFIRFTISIFALVSINAIAEFKTLTCSTTMSTLDNKFYNALFSGRDNGEDVKDSLAILKEAENCVITSLDKAQWIDLKGEALHMTYKYSKDQTYFEESQHAFEEALALNTPRNEKIYHHLAELMRSAGKYDEATEYINKVLSMQPQPMDPLPYLETAFQLAVDVTDWKNADIAYRVIKKRDPEFYRDPGLLLSTVKFFCHLGMVVEADTMVKQNETYMKDSGFENNNAWQQLLNSSKIVIAQCQKHQISI